MEDPAVPDEQATDNVLTDDVAKWRELGKIVRDRREALGITLEQAAARSGGTVSRGVWSNFERATQDSYRIRTLNGISRALGWPPEGLIYLHNGRVTLEELNWAATPASDPLGSGPLLPAALSGDTKDLTPEEVAKVRAFIEGLRAARESHA